MFGFVIFGAKILYKKMRKKNVDEIDTWWGDLSPKLATLKKSENRPFLGDKKGDFGLKKIWLKMTLNGLKYYKTP